jgi:hypothetical protein
VQIITRPRSGPDALSHGVGRNLGDRLERAVVFGSRARRCRPDSDYEIAIFIRFHEPVRLADLGTGILMNTGAVISAKPFRASSYNEDRPLMNAIRTEGVDL